MKRLLGSNRPKINTQLYFSDQQQSQQIKNKKQISKIQHFTTDNDEINRFIDSKFKRDKPIIGEQTAKNQQDTQLIRPRCGCGLVYKCKGSLYLHIRSKHGGIPPLGTIDGKQMKNKSEIQSKLVKKESQQPLAYKNTKFESNQKNQRVLTSKNSTRNSEDEGYFIKSQNQSKHQNQRHICSFCGRFYGSKSAVSLHFKRKHALQNQKNQGLQKNFQCSLCNLSYQSKSALSLHITNKHSTAQREKMIIEQFSASNQLQIERCGCGKQYESRSALNMHIKKKHGGKPPLGTQRPTKKQSYQALQDQLQNLQIENHFRAQRNSSNDNDDSIYDSNSEIGKATQDSKIYDQTPILQYQQPIQSKNLQPQQNYNASIFKPTPQISTSQENQDKPFKCGCGRRYTCSSSLNLHIKKNHNWIVPQGTIGGPRGIRIQDGTIYQQTYKTEFDQIICQTCNIQCSDSHFKCSTCPKHIMCSSCFWKDNNFNTGHEWVVQNRD